MKKHKKKVNKQEKVDTNLVGVSDVSDKSIPYVSGDNGEKRKDKEMNIDNEGIGADQEIFGDNEDQGNVADQRNAVEQSEPVVEHLMTDNPNDPPNDIIEDTYGTNVYTDNLTNNVQDLKHYLRREKTIRENLSLKCASLEKLWKAREVVDGDNEKQKMKEEIVLMEETYKHALKLFLVESMRSDLSLNSLIEKADMIERMRNEAVYDQQEELLDQKRYCDDSAIRIEDQANTIKSSMEKELKLLHEVPDLRKKLEQKGKEFQRKCAVLQEKISIMERGGKADDGLAEHMKTLEKVNVEVKKQAYKNLKMYM